MVRTAVTTIAASVAIAASLLTIAVYANQRDQNQRAVNHAVCSAVYRLDKAIVATLQRSRDSLPKLAYYREHPNELRRQQVDIAREIRTFSPPRACGSAEGGT